MSYLDEHEPQGTRPFIQVLAESLLGTVIVMFGWLPIGAAIYSIFDAIGLELSDGWLLAIVGGATIGAAIGSTFLLRRVMK